MLSLFAINTMDCKRDQTKARLFQNPAQQMVHLLVVSYRQSFQFDKNDVDEDLGLSTSNKVRYFLHF